MDEQNVLKLIKYILTSRDVSLKYSAIKVKGDNTTLFDCVKYLDTKLLNAHEVDYADALEAYRNNKRVKSLFDGEEFSINGNSLFGATKDQIKNKWIIY